MRGPRTLAAAFLAAALGGAGDARAMADFAIEPLRLELSKARTNGSLRLRNNGDTPVTVQVDAVAWSQRDGRDVLEPTQAVVVSPPIFRMPAKGGQTIRVGHVGKPDAVTEASFRVLIREVPQAPAAQTGISTVLQLSLPVFVAPDKPAAPELAWRLTRAAGKLQLEVRNRGNAHAQVGDFKLLPNLVPAGVSVAGYVLPGQSRNWEWEARDVPPGALRATYRLNGQPTEAPLVAGN